MRDRPTKIFLAHASEDKQKVIEIYDRLLKLGYAPWLDIKSLIPGQIWREEIPKAIQESDIFVACFSNKSVNKEGYIQKELRIALNKLAKIPPGRIYLIPLRLDACEIPELQIVNLGLNLRDIQRLDYWKEDGFEILIKAIKYATGNKTNRITIEKQENRNSRTEVQQENQDEIKNNRDKTDSKDNESDSILLQVFEFNIVTFNNSGEEQHRKKSKAYYFRENLGNGVSLDMVQIPGGTFMMGSPDNEGNNDEKPQHEVTVSSFFIGKYQITQKQWQEIAKLPSIERDLDLNPSKFTGDNLPVEQVSWDDAIEFCARLSKKAGREYRLPSEAEWEYACRAGTRTPFHFGETITREVVNCKRNLLIAIAGMFMGETTEVGSFKVANGYGLYDMHGNVWEWCQDDWHENYQNAPDDGTAWLSGQNNNTKVLRGGAWGDNPSGCRSAFRYLSLREPRGSLIGFRVVCGFGRNL